MTDDNAADDRTADDQTANGRMPNDLEADDRSANYQLEIADSREPWLRRLLPSDLPMPNRLADELEGLIRGTRPESLPAPQATDEGTLVLEPADPAERAVASRPRQHHAGPPAVGRAGRRRPVTRVLLAACALLVVGSVTWQVGLTLGSGDASEDSGASLAPFGELAPTGDVGGSALRSATPTEIPQPASAPAEVSVLPTRAVVDYDSDGLADQVREQLSRQSAAMAGPALDGADISQDCIAELADSPDARPVLVQRATFEGKPAILVVLADSVPPALDAWLVAPTCSAADPGILDYARIGDL